MIALTSRPWAEIESTILLRPGATVDEEAQGEPPDDEDDDDNEKCDLTELLRGAAEFHADLKVRLSSSVNEAACGELAALLKISPAEAVWQLVGSPEGLSVHSALIANRPAGSWARFVFEADGDIPLSSPSSTTLELPVRMTSDTENSNRNDGNQEDWRRKLPIEVQLARALAEAYGAPTVATIDESTAADYNENKLIAESLPSKKAVVAAQRDLRQHLHDLLSTGAGADMRVRCSPATPSMGSAERGSASESKDLGAASPHASNDDETVASSDVEVPCHKFVLAYRSPYFKAAIEHAPITPLVADKSAASVGKPSTSSTLAASLPTVSLPDECSAAPTLSQALLKCVYGGLRADEEALIAEIEEGAHGGASSLVPLAYTAHSLMMPHLSYEALSVLARSGPASKNTSKSSGIGSGSNGSSEKSRVYIDSANAPSLLSVAEQLGHPLLRRACVSYIVAHLADVTDQSPFFADLVTPQRKATLSALAAASNSNFLSCGCLLDDAREFLGMLNEVLDEQRVRHSDALERQQLEWQDWVEDSRRVNTLASAAVARFGPVPSPDTNNKHGNECDSERQDSASNGRGSSSSSGGAPPTVAAMHAHAQARAEQKACLERKERLLKVDAALTAQSKHLQAARQFLRSQEETFANIGTLSAEDETKTVPAEVPNLSSAVLVPPVAPSSSSIAPAETTTTAAAASPSSTPSLKGSSAASVTGPLPEFVPRYEWREVLPGQSIDAGLEVTLNVGSGIDSGGSSDRSSQNNTRARIPPVWRLKVWVEPTERTPLPPRSSTPAAAVSSAMPHLRCVRFPADRHPSDDEDDNDDAEWRRSAKYFRRDIQPLNTVADVAASVVNDFTAHRSGNRRCHASGDVQADPGTWRAAIGLRGLPLHGARHDTWHNGDGRGEFHNGSINGGNGANNADHVSMQRSQAAADDSSASQEAAPRPLCISESGEVFWALAPDRPFSPNLWMRQSDLAAFVYRA